MVNTPKDAPEERWPAASPRSDGTSSRTVFSLSEEETFELGRSFGLRLKGGALVVLVGELGLGKTVFARGISAALGIPPEDVSSPSYTLVHEYRGGRVAVFHIDLYRIDASEELASLGLDEILTAGGVVIAEWGERLPPLYRRDAVMVRFHDVGEGSRRIEIVHPAGSSTRFRGDA